MPYKRKSKKQKSDVRAGPQQKQQQQQQRGDVFVSEYSNDKFTHFYKLQNIVRDDADWDAMMESMRQVLPVSFRITKSNGLSERVKSLLEQDFFPQLMAIKNDDGQPLMPPPQTVPFYPDGLAYQLDVTKRDLRKQDAYQRFHQFLVAHTDVGNISRQETVSMIPPLVLDVQPGHRVLDMCAAPGSKTAQLLESLHSNSGDVNGAIQDGFVIANDADSKRSHMLAHMAARLGSECLLVTNHEAQQFPTLYQNVVDDENGREGQTQMLFDRILADVPCSGDGTMRKNPMIWKRWSVMDSVGLHKLQALILNRAIQLLKVGGRVVYSTCSLNPLEDEAVVAQCLKVYGGKLKLIDASHMLPGLKYRHGLSQWKVVDKEGQVLTKDYLKDSVQQGNKFTESMFPPEADDVASLNLNYCMRILPHDQNTGGFFIAVLEKTGSTSTADGKILYGRQSNSNDNSINSAKSKEAPVVRVEPDYEVVQNFMQNYGISEQFPRDQFTIRSDKVDVSILKISYASRCLLDMIAVNSQKLQIINAGVKAFSRMNNRRTKEMAIERDVNQLRLFQEFLPIVADHVDPQKCVIEMTCDDLQAAMTTQFPLMDQMSSKVQGQLRRIFTGGLIIKVQSDLLQSPLYIPAWKSRASINILLDKQERLAVLSLMYPFEQSQEVMASFQQSIDSKKIEQSME
ncbi:hypothetical protein MP228_008485 [Amoeboaphelidium protococcarum]|nr:hypothetical protein MP228_008485 [Amoeboaphelidium protococcarum]